MSPTITLPDLLAISNWPYECVMNPHHLAVALESMRWMESFQILTSKALATFHYCDFPLLTSLIHPSSSREHLRLAVDLMYWFFLVDELTEVQSGEAARELTSVLLEVLRDPSQPLPAGTAVIGEMTRDLWSRFLEFSVPSSAARLQKHLEEYIESVFGEARHREAGYIHSTVQQYLLHRRNTSGAKALLDIYTLTVDIPENVMSHPQIRRFTEDASDLISIHNEVYSYSSEQAHGIHAHSLVTAVVNENALSIQDALDYCGELFRQRTRSFLDNLQNVPSFPSYIEQGLFLHTEGVGRFVAGFEEWSYRSQRYFGTNGRKVQRSRKVSLAAEPSRPQYDCQLQTNYQKPRQWTRRSEEMLAWIKCRISHAWCTYYYCI